MVAYAKDIPAPPDAMTILQDQLYTSLLASSLGLEASSFQLSQPAPSIPPSDSGLWAYLNVIPPLSLTFNRSQYADSFFSNYAAVVAQLIFSPTLESVIGAQAYAAWSAYLSTLTPQPSICEQAPLFRTWADRNGYSGIAMQGASNLNANCIFLGQQQAIQPYQGPSAQPVDFVGGYSALTSTLPSSRPFTLNFDSTTASGNVTGSWAGGLQRGISGLWFGLDPLQRISQLFASSQVTFSAQIQHNARWVSTPGGWYSSSLLNTAYTNTTSPPWPAAANPNWDEAFGALGSMQRFISWLLVADGITITLSAQASFTAADQAAIDAHIGDGIWPFYMPSSATVSNTASFDSDGHLKISTSSPAGHPVVLGAAVLPIAQYLGRPPT